MRIRKIWVAVALTLGCLALPAGADASMTYLGQFGSLGLPDGQFGSPRGITTGANGDVFVVDAFKINVQRFSSAGAYQSKFGSAGSGAGEFTNPNGIVADGSDNLIITENTRFDRYSQAGAFAVMGGWGVQDGADAYQTCTSGCQAGLGDGTKPGGLKGAIATTVMGNGQILVVDQESLVKRYDASLGFLGNIGTGGSGDGQYTNPDGVGVDASDNIYIADYTNSRIVKFDSSGNFVSTWGWGVQDGGSSYQICTSGCQAGISGSGDGQFGAIAALTVDATRGRVYAIDGDRIEVFATDGTYLSQYGSPGSGDGEFNGPQGLTVDCNGALYVADSGNARVQRIGEPGTALCDGSGGGGNNNGGGGGNNNGGGGGNADSVAPRILGVAVAPKRFRVGGRLTKRDVALKCRGKKGKRRKACATRIAKLTYELSENAVVEFQIEGIAKGRKVAGKCKRTSRRNRTKPRCTVYRKVTAFKRDAKAGKTSERFTGKIGKRKMRPGLYRLTAVAHDAAGNSSLVVSNTFTVLRR